MYGQQTYIQGKWQGDVHIHWNADVTRFIRGVLVQEDTRSLVSTTLDRRNSFPMLQVATPLHSAPSFEDQALRGMIPDG